MKSAASPPSARGVRAEFNSRARALRLVIGLVFGFVLAGVPILLHLVAQPLAVAFGFCFAALIAVYFDEQVPTVLFISYLFQSTFVALASPYVDSAAGLEPMKSADFITTLSMWGVMMGRFVLEFNKVSPFIRRLVLGVSVVLAIAGLYFVAGLALNPRNATIYMRNVALPVILFQACLLAAARHPMALRGTVAILLTLLVVCGYFELFDVGGWLTVTHGWRYLDLSFASQLKDPFWIEQAQQNGMIIKEPLDLLRVNFLNLNLFGGLHLQITRLQGPTFQPISFGYSLAAFTIFAALHRHFLLALAAVPLLLFASAKGALVMILVSLAFSFAGTGPLRRAVVPALGVFLAVYAAAIFVSGRSTGDFHVLGLLGGVNGFVAQPWGHTLGQGGNLATDFAKLDWSKFQHVGAADTALESAVGVMLYQMGIAAIPVLLVYVWVARVAWRLHKSLPAPALAMATSTILVVLVNGIFQEEALFAPLGLGLVMVFAGLTLGATDRVCAAQFAPASRASARPARLDPRLSESAS